MLALAVSALLWPPRERPSAAETFLVLDPCAEARGRDVFAPLAGWLSQKLGRPLRLAVTPALTPQLLRSASLVLCPDLPALAVADSGFVPLALGRRQAPQNLRPRSVLVRRLAAAPADEPWLSAPRRTACGDSLSLAGAGVLRRAGRAAVAVAAARGVRFGPDPYDHGPVLHALRLGCFDYAVVREWAARRFFAVGLLDRQAYGLLPLSEPLPDVVVLGTRRWAMVDLLRTRELLVGLGRQAGAASAVEREVLHGLSAIRLDGFNLLLEPDFEQIHRQYGGRWLAPGN